MLSAARELLEEGETASLSLRAVARRLRVAPNALYSHVTGTTDLVDAVLDDLLSAVTVPESGDPVERLTALLLDSYDVLVAHPGLVPLYLARQGVRGEQGVRLGENMDALLSGVGVEDVAQARRALLVHVMGSAAFADSTRTEGAALSAEQARALFVRSLAWLLAGMSSPAARPAAEPA